MPMKTWRKTPQEWTRAWPEQQQEQVPEQGMAQ